MNSLRKLLLVGGLAFITLFGAAASSQAQSFSFSIHGGDPYYREYYPPRYYYPPRRVYYVPAPRYYYAPPRRYYRHEYREHRRDRREYRHDRRENRREYR